LYALGGHRRLVFNKVTCWLLGRHLPDLQTRLQPRRSV
jgi:hypothetical protein